MLHLIYHWVIIFRSLLRSRDSSLTILDVKKQYQFEKTVLLTPIWTGAALPPSRCRACAGHGDGAALPFSCSFRLHLQWPWSRSLSCNNLCPLKKVSELKLVDAIQESIRRHIHSYLPQLLKASERLKPGSFCLGESPLLLQHPVSLCTQLSWTHMCQVIGLVLTCVININKA